VLPLVPRSFIGCSARLARGLVTARSGVVRAKLLCLDLPMLTLRALPVLLVEPLNGPCECRSINDSGELLCHQYPIASMQSSLCKTPHSSRAHGSYAGVSGGSGGT